MPLLGGIFAKRDKSSAARSAPANLNVPTATTSAASISSTVVSSEPDYVFPDKSFSLPETIYTASTSTAASSSKLKLPFRSKKHVYQPRVTPTSPAIVSLNDAPQNPHISRVASDSALETPSPPRKSSVFSIYHDRNVNSAPSLPNESTQHLDISTKPSAAKSECHAVPPSTHPSPNRKPGGLFSWARERTKSRPSPPPAILPTTTSPCPPPGDSFNLKAFRHVRSQSPPPPHDLDADLPLPPARPRPRGDSSASNSSQRISVAAFREAQARRSCANSPVHSFRPPSSMDTLRADNNSRKRASTFSSPSLTELPPPISRTSTTPQLSIQTNRNSSAFLTSESDDSDDEDDEEVDSDGAPIKPSRNRTIRRSPAALSRSDAGHFNDHSQPPDTRRWPKLDNVQPRQPLNTTAMRMRASVSTSALTPNAAARRASILAAANASSAASAKPLPLPRNDDCDDSDSSNSDSENMPLSAFVAPRRPGSAASVSTSSSRPRVPVKPLIDIKSLVGSPPMLTPVLRHEHSVKQPPKKGKQHEVGKDEPFAPPPVISFTPSRLTESPSQSPSGSAPQLPRHRKSNSDLGAFSKLASMPTEDDHDLMTAIKLVTSLEKSEETSLPNPAPAVDQEESAHNERIMPTPVREYKPPASFSVTSRPPRRYSADIPSPVSATFKRSSSPQGSPSPIKSAFARSRAATLAQVQDSPSKEKSDSSSVASTSRSSRSSRIPSIPLINTVPESPSVKASWGTSKDLYKTRGPSVPGLMDSGMARPSSNIVPSSMQGMPLAPQSSRLQTQTLMPSRPFASNSSLRGQSPAGSSTGDSSSGRGPPFTPRDGSDIGMHIGLRDGSDADSTLKARGRRSIVSFEEDPPRGRERVKNGADDEQRRNERRRSEAKAAIELGKIVNGRGPIVHNDSDDEDLLLQPGQRMNINPIMSMDGSMPGMNPATWAPWQQPMATGMSQMMPQLNNDPTFFAAHQHAMMIAKQAYQMAVAQHAMAVAGDEWERSSNIGGGSSVYGGGGGSVYGGGGGSVYGGMGGGGGGGLLTVPGMGMPGMMQNQWPRSSMAFPNRIGSSQSEFGGGSRSVYGESFPSMSSRSGYASSGYDAPNNAMSAYGGNPRPRAKTGVSQPSPSQAPTRSPPRNAAPPPPSSWKNAR